MNVNTAVEMLRNGEKFAAQRECGHRNLHGRCSGCIAYLAQRRTARKEQ